MIQTLNSDDNFEVFFFDEGRFGIRSTVMRTWTQKGCPAITKVKLGYTSSYMYSSISSFTGENFNLFLPGVCTEFMSIYLDEFSQYLNGRKAVLIMDQAGWHRAKDLIIPENIKIIFLPPYSPELNPVERFWKAIKRACVHNRVFETLEELLEVISDYIIEVQDDKIKRICHCTYL